MDKAAANLSWTERALADRICACLAKNDLPTSADYPAEELAHAASADKKRAGSDITVVLPRAIGACQLKKIPVTDLLTVIRAGLEG
jgi:3-dehydroquinate synthase